VVNGPRREPSAADPMSMRRVAVELGTGPGYLDPGPFDVEIVPWTATLPRPGRNLISTAVLLAGPGFLRGQGRHGLHPVPYELPATLTEEAGRFRLEHVPEGELVVCAGTVHACRARCRAIDSADLGLGTGHPRTPPPTEEVRSQRWCPLRRCA
jgi:hypothetical protein